MISIIVCSNNDGRYRALAGNYARLLQGESHELIRIPDARSLAEGYNRGFRQSKGEIVLFCHDDIEILNGDFKHRVHRHLHDFDLIGIAGTRRVICGSWAAAGHPYVYGQVAHPGDKPGRVAVDIFAAPLRAIPAMQALDGVFLAARREVVEKVGFDEQTFDGFHCYDSDFTFRAYLAGYRLAVCCDINVFHASRGTPDDSWHRYMAAFQKKFTSRMYPMEPRQFIYSEVVVQTRAEIVEVMTPPHWPQE